MKLTILSVAYPLTEVGPDAVGGSEQILTHLDRALTSAGHRSVVIAAEGSKVQGTLIPSPRAGRRVDDVSRELARRIHHELIRQTLSDFRFDVVHMHSLDFHAYMPPAGPPVLATLHLPPDWYPREIFQMERDCFYLNCVSEAQQRSSPPSPAFLPPIPNGVDVVRFSPNAPKADFVLAMGRICPEKGFHFALQAARLAGVRMTLAGEVHPYESHHEYFRSEIAPLLDERRQFVGPLKWPQKSRALSQARCVLIPSTVAETSSLVAMEALACGTPVVAFRNGALPEVVEDGRTGYLVSTVAEMASAIKRVDQLDPRVCREVALARFSSERMTSEYLNLYSRLAAKQARVPSARELQTKSWVA